MTTERTRRSSGPDVCAAHSPAALDEARAQLTAELGKGVRYVRTTFLPGGGSK
jgi:hypothetical protein